MGTHMYETGAYKQTTHSARTSVALADCVLLLLMIDCHLTNTLSFLCTLDSGAQGITLVNHHFIDLDCAHRLHCAGIWLVYP